MAMERLAWAQITMEKKIFFLLWRQSQELWNQLNFIQTNGFEPAHGEVGWCAVSIVADIRIDDGLFAEIGRLRRAIRR